MNWLVFVVILLRSVHGNKSFLNSSAFNLSTFKNITLSVEGFVRDISQNFSTFEVIRSDDDTTDAELMNEILEICSSSQYPIEDENVHRHST